MIELLYTLQLSVIGGLFLNSFKKLVVRALLNLKHFKHSCLCCKRCFISSNIMYQRFAPGKHRNQNITTSDFSMIKSKFTVINVYG